MKKRTWTIVAVAAALAGTGLHFLWQAFPNLFFALFSPVNESPWEHLKLLFWPTVAAAAVLAFRTRDPIGVWSGFFPVLLAQPVLTLGGYSLFRALGLESTALDILLYYVVMAFSFWAAWFLRKNRFAQRAAGILLMLVILYGAALVLFTFAAPACGVFRAP